jgi:Phage integrase family
VKLLWTCWRYRETQTAHIGPLKGQKIETDKRPLRHVARFILIGLYTGTRAGAIATASPFCVAGKSFVDLDNGIFHWRAIGKRATTKRQTPVPLPNRLLAHLRRWSRLGIAKSHFVEWNGKPVASVKTGFASAVRIAGLDVAVGKVTPHTLRHTAATWLMQAGAPMWEAAGFLGMSEKTLRDTYGHHHPDFLRVAANAIGTRPAPNRNVVLVDRLVDEKSKRSKVPQTIEITGGPGRTRTCNQTVMSDRKLIGFVDFAEFSFRFDRVCCGLVRSFLVRNWCGCPTRSAKRTEWAIASFLELRQLETVSIVA